MRASLSILGLSFLVLVFSSSFCLAENYWQVYESTAHTSVLLKGNSGQALASFIISFKSNTGCQMEIAFMLTKNGDQGTYIERRSTKEDMVLNIDGSKYSEKTVFTKYSDGIEVAMYGNNAIFNKLTASRNATLKVTENSQGYKFSLVGADTAVRKAFNVCIQR